MLTHCVKGKEHTIKKESSVLSFAYYFRFELRAYILESLGVNATSITRAARIHRGSRDSSGGFRHYGFMLNGSWTHHCIHRPVGNSTTGAKRHS